MTTNCLSTARCPRTLKILLVGSLLLFAKNLGTIPASAQFPPMSPPQLDRLVARIALYPEKNQKKLEKADGEMFDHFPPKSKG